MSSANASKSSMENNLHKFEINKTWNAIEKLKHASKRCNDYVTEQYGAMLFERVICINYYICIYIRNTVRNMCRYAFDAFSIFQLIQNSIKLSHVSHFMFLFQ